MRGEGGREEGKSNNFSGNDISDQEIGMPAGLVGNNSSLITSFGRRESHGTVFRVRDYAIDFPRRSNARPSRPTVLQSVVLLRYFTCYPVLEYSREIVNC